MHKILLLSHLDCLGLRVNFAKSTLSPSQRVLFLGTVIDSMQMTTTVSAEQATRIQRHTASLKEGAARPLKENAGPYGSGFAGTSVGSASHATHPVLAEKVHQRHHETREAVTDHITHLEVIIRNIYSVSIQNTEYTHWTHFLLIAQLWTLISVQTDEWESAISKLMTGWHLDKDNVYKLCKQPLVWHHTQTAAFISQAFVVRWW